MKFEKFEDLEVWQFARELVKLIYKITSKKNFAKDFGLSHQLQRCSVSVMSNIAEGFERQSSKEFIRFLYMAKASAGELRSQLHVSLDLNYINKNEFDELYKLSQKISKSIAGFIKYLKSLDPKSCNLKSLDCKSCNLESFNF